MHDEHRDDWVDAATFLRQIGFVRGDANWVLRPGNRDHWVEAGVLLELRTRPDAKRAKLMISPSRFYAWQRECSLERLRA